MTEYSIIIPTFNRCAFLKEALDSIKAQEFLEVFEIIIIDNGSHDNTFEIVIEFVLLNPQFKITYLYDEIPGLLTGRHLGAFNAQGNILCYLDDDIILSKQWTKSVKEGFEKNKEIGLLTGPSFPNFEASPPKWLSYFWTVINNYERICAPLSLLDFGKHVKFINPNYVWGLNFCIKRELFWKLNGFHPDNVPQKLQMFQGDGETGLTMKAHFLGIKALYHPEASLLHHVSKERLTKEYFGKRFYYQGICDSYTLLRKQADNHSSQKTSMNWRGLLYQKIKFEFRKFWLNAEIYFEKIKMSHEAYLIKKHADTMYKKGFRFHQESFCKNEYVKSWVLKKDYFNYKIPNND